MDGNAPCHLIANLTPSHHNPAAEPSCASRNFASNLKPCRLHQELTACQKHAIVVWFSPAPQFWWHYFPTWMIFSISKREWVDIRHQLQKRSQGTAALGLQSPDAPHLPPWWPFWSRTSATRCARPGDLPWRAADRPPNLGVFGVAFLVEICSLPMIRVVVTEPLGKFVSKKTNKKCRRIRIMVFLRHSMSGVLEWIPKATSILVKQNRLFPSPQRPASLQT